MEKNKFHHFWPLTLENFWKHSLVPPCKNLSDAHAHKHIKLHHFYRKLCCITPYVNTVKQHQCGEQAIAQWQTVHDVFCQTNAVRNPAKFTTKLQIILHIILTKYCQISATCFSSNDLLQQWTQY